MIGVRTIQKSFPCFGFFTTPFLFLLRIALALDGLIAYAAPPVGFFELPLRTKRFPTVDQHKMYNLGNLWHSRRLSEDPPALQLTVEKKHAQSTMFLQKPLLTKVIA